MSNIEKNKNSFIYDFLINPKFKIWRHIAVILSALIMSVNQTIVNNFDILPLLDNFVYIWILLTFISYTIAIYINLYIFIPKYLLKRKYAQYLLSISAIILLAIFSQDLIEYIVHAYWGLPYEYLLIFISNLPALFVNLMCLGGISIPIYLRNWILYKKKVSQLEKDKTYSVVEQLKEQVNPTFLFEILNRTGVLARSEPDRASDMLMKLSLLLRYQLYDCNREKVLLISEITFLRNYLELEQKYSPDFEFSIDTQGDIYRTFIPPLLFLTFIQNAIRSIDPNNKKGSVEVNITANEDEIALVCKAKNGSEIALSDAEYERAIQRLGILYNNDYTLSASNDKEAKESLVSLKLKNSRI